MSHKKTRHRISYVLPLPGSPGGHRLGVNSLAIDCDSSILYSAGRDGVICAWDVNLPLRSTLTDRYPFPQTASSKAHVFRDQAKAHTHWVNDILLAQSNEALVSASSDITVKVWRPHAQDGQIPVTIGQHGDYVKCLASPGKHSDWVASGGLDHKIMIWDLSGGGEKLKVDVCEEEDTSKGSVYALSVRGSIMASGGPDNVVRLWDPKSGKRITKFNGHTDTIRDILINEAGDTIMTASSDQTIKIWSMAAGRCMNTLTMHNDSVWSLYSDHPQLSLFYSSDRSGLVAKTDVRGSYSMDEGISVALAQENEGVHKIIVGGNYFWTATSRSSINRWKDVDTNSEIQAPESPRQNRLSSLVSRAPKLPSPPVNEAPATNGNGEAKKIPLNSILKISNALPKIRDLESSTIYSAQSIRKSSLVPEPEPEEILVAFNARPEETIEGQNGLIKHVILNDKKRVLTLDSTGDVVLWDLLKCVPIKSFGKRHLDDVVPEIETQENVAQWCTVDTKTGRLAVGLEENYAFEAELYANEMSLDENIELKEDQRINPGKWILRYLFANLIDEEIKRDEDHRSGLKTAPPEGGFTRSNLPRLASLPSNTLNGWTEDSIITPRAVNGHTVQTPGLSIAVATPGPGVSGNAHAAPTTPGGLSTLEEASDLKKTITSNARTSIDYFSSTPPAQPGSDKASNDDTIPQSPSEPAEKDAKSSSRFGKKFNMKMSFPKKLGRTSVEVKTSATEDKAEELSDKSSEKEEKVFDDNFSGCIQKIRHGYDEALQSNPGEPLAPGITPSLPSETPVLQLPPSTTIIIQEDRPESGGIKDLYRGTVRSVGQDANLIEKAAPVWLGDLLLRNQLPPKTEIVKIPFILQPYDNLLPGIAGADGNARLNANRMLRAKKILAYVTERIDPPDDAALQANVNDLNNLDPDPSTDGTTSSSYAPKPEEYLDLYCQGQKLDPEMTLNTIRYYVWKSSTDLLLYYKGNGRKPELEERWKEEKERKRVEEQGPGEHRKEEGEKAGGGEVGAVGNGTGVGAGAGA